MNLVKYDVVHVDDEEHIFEVDTFRNKEVIVKDKLLHKILQADADAG
jgi:hypothetical protein